MDAIPVPLHKFSHMHVDLVGPRPRAAEGHTHLLTVVHGQDYEVGRGNHFAVHNCSGGGRLLCGQLGGTFWGAGYHHN